MKHMDALTDKLGGLDLKTKQGQAVRRKDVLAVLPTGFHKSPIYQAFSLLKSCENTGTTTSWLTCARGAFVLHIFFKSS